MRHAAQKPCMVHAGGLHRPRQSPTVANARPLQMVSSADEAGHVTPAVWIYVWISLFLGFMMGYSFSSSLLLQNCQSYLSMFFPETLAQYQQAGAPGFITSHTSARYVGPYMGAFGAKWCTYDSPKFAWVLASRYFAATASTAGAAWVTHYCGRRAAVLVAICVHLVGTVLFASSWNLAQLIIGNLLIGIGTGIIYVSIIVSNVEIAPTRHRGALTALNMVGATFGFLCGICVFWAKDMRFSTHGWRIAVALGGWPAIVALLLWPWLPETPDSLIQRGKLAEGREALERVRGPFCDINQDITSIWWSATGGQSSNGVPSIWQQLKLLPQPCHVIPVVVCSLLSVFREFVGIFVMAPVLPQLLDGVRPFGSSEPQLWQAGLVLHSIMIFGGLVAVLLMDTIGRRPLLLSGGVVGTVAWGTLAGLMGAYGSARELDKHGLVPLLLAMSALTSAADGASLYTVWAVVTAESQMLCVRTSAVAICTGCMLLVRAVVQVVLQDMLCTLQWKTLILAAAAYFLSIVVTALMLPETKQVPLGDMSGVWSAHWLWRRWLRKPAATARSP